MIYTFGTWLGHYKFAHSEVAVCLNAAKGFIANGRAAEVLWCGETRVFEGVQHRNYKEAALGPRDTLIIFHPAIAAAVAVDPAFTNIMRAGRKWVYTNGAYGPAEAGQSVYHKQWQAFDRILVECPNSHADVQAQFPNKPVTTCWLGCSHDVDLHALTDPYPQSLESRHLFFAGRLSHPREMLELMSTLSDKYELWIAARTLIALNGDWYYVHVGNEPGQKCYGLADIGEITEEDAKALVVDTFQHDPRVHYIGSLPFGSFYNWHHYAFASLDIGLELMPPSLNCKVFDAIRAGSRIITYGESPSYFLLDKYNAGVSLAWKDYQAVAATLDGWQPEPRELRFQRAEAFRDGESWHSRTRDLLPLLE